MSAAEFQRLLAEFRAGWTELDSGHFNLEIRVPGCVSTWEPAYDPDEFELVANVCLPFRESPKSEDDFTLSGFAVIQKSPPLSATKQGKRRAKYRQMHNQCMAAINRFKRLSCAAGAALPDVIRERLVGYCPWHCKSPACWWIALLAHVCGITAYNAANDYQVEHGIPRPWLISIEMIGQLRLNSENPQWPDSGTNGDRTSESIVDDPITLAQAARMLLMPSPQTIYNKGTETRPAPAIPAKGKKAAVWSYRTLRPWLLAQFPQLESRIPEEYAAALRLFFMSG